MFIQLFTVGELFITWLDYVRTTLDKQDLLFVFSNQTVGVNFTWFMRAVKLKLLDGYEQEWVSDIQNNPVLHLLSSVQNKLCN